MCIRNSRRCGVLSMMNLRGSFLLGAIACSGESEIESPEAAASEEKLWTSADVERTWVFKASDSQWRGQFEGNPGWTALFNRDYESA